MNFLLLGMSVKDWREKADKEPQVVETPGQLRLYDVALMVSTQYYPISGHPIGCKNRSCNCWHKGKLFQAEFATKIFSLFMYITQKTLISLYGYFSWSWLILYVDLLVHLGNFTFTSFYLGTFNKTNNKVIFGELVNPEILCLNRH